MSDKTKNSHGDASTVSDVTAGKENFEVKTPTTITYTTACSLATPPPPSGTGWGGKLQYSRTATTATEQPLAEQYPDADGTVLEEQRSDFQQAVFVPYLDPMDNGPPSTTTSSFVPGSDTVGSIIPLPRLSLKRKEAPLWDEGEAPYIRPPQRPSVSQFVSQFRSDMEEHMRWDGVMGGEGDDDDFEGIEQELTHLHLSLPSPTRTTRGSTTSAMMIRPPSTTSSSSRPASTTNRPTSWNDNLPIFAPTSDFQLSFLEGGHPGRRVHVQRPVAAAPVQLYNNDDPQDYHNPSQEMTHVAVQTTFQPLGNVGTTMDEGLVVSSDNNRELEQGGPVVNADHGRRPFCSTPPVRRG